MTDASIPLFLALCIVLIIAILFQYNKHNIWWSGFFETATSYINHKHFNYTKEIITAQDGEDYIIWWPQKLNRSSTSIWICVPGAMKKLSECIEVLERDYNAFDGSNWCVYNQPGIEDGTIMKNKPTPPPTDITYLFEFIQSIHAQKRYKKISVIGCSMGALSSLFLVDKLSQYKPKKYVEQIVMIHSPEFIRETFEHLYSNWFFRFDILCARHVYLFNLSSKSWSKFNINTKMKTSWYHGWLFMKEITEHIVGSKWKQLEFEWYNPHRVLSQNHKNGKIICCDIKRIISKNDPIVSFKSIDQSYFKYYNNITIFNTGGHCVANKSIANKISEWNQQVI
eukprot:247293_1